MTPKRSKRWLFKLTSLIVITTFISTQILPPGWAQSISITEQIQKQTPEKQLPEVPQEKGDR
ncbi:MAG: hypothetical protein HY583_00190, partial [Candidatus Omnitrophica bacterium]|nr:hypothetical protein [Candidatus Omnitrophota bacterium]